MPGPYDAHHRSGSGVRLVELAMKTKLCECGCGGQISKGRRFVKGHNKGNFKSGIIVRNDGYVLVKAPGHPRANPKGYVLEHILVMEKVLGRPVLLSEAIHHFDGKRGNNVPGNLILFATNKMHLEYHTRLTAYEICGHYDWRKCPVCHRYDSIEKLRPHRSKRGSRYIHQVCRSIKNREYRANKKAA